MSNLNKLNFIALEVSGRNYLKWVQDVKLHLTAKNLHPAIEDEMDNPVDEAEKAIAMIFIRRHIHDHYGSLWLIILITKRTSSYLKQDMTGSICASKTLSM
ncbi:hypothetical protein D8674_021587 [Pyrus ussuriensis x Pyrus communis]|uniref:Retrotransposon Copia-like N-terminal domain-containing protein n=1 Tax=Pyrus ussuriensis x Pyrus communis TaxID=2448454 RepID=A0A5N5GHJ1_9ROSA|nr:hypothetical protein D8674_021587 [Pyrus ussuriensis x Pyrus communis]